MAGGGGGGGGAGTPAAAGGGGGGGGGGGAPAEAGGGGGEAEGRMLEMHLLAAEEEVEAEMGPRALKKQQEWGVRGGAGVGQVGGHSKQIAVVGVEVVEAGQL